MIFLYRPDYIWKTFLQIKNVKLYDETCDYNPDKDMIICPVYWQYHSLQCVMKRRYSRALLNINAKGKPNYILTNHINEMLNKKNAKLVLYSGWETMDFDSHINKINTFVLRYLKLPLNKVYFTSSNFLYHMKFLHSNILSYDWPYLREKTIFNKDNIIPYHSNKKYRIITLNRRSSYERYFYCYYLYKNHREKALFSYIGRCGMLGKFNISKQNVHFDENDIKSFNASLPMILDGKDPNWNAIDTISKFIEQSYIFVTFETNLEKHDSKCQQVSEKSYKGIKMGRPFIIFNTKGGILQHLKNLGFKTFSPYINEEYDNDTLSYNKRYELLLKETDRICNLSEDEINNMYLKLEKRVMHNLEVLESKENIPIFFENIT